MSEKEGAFPSAYSSFAVSVDSRNAERPSYSTPPGSDSAGGILRPGRGTTSPYSRPLSHEKRRSLSPRSQDRLDIRGPKPGVRFTKDTIHEYEHVPLLQHHRRSSTAAFLEYIRTHLPESHSKASIALTPRRALMLFAIVFSATYLALGVMPMLASYTGIGSPVTVVIKRGDGYYGNSHIFRGGENLADPHLAGDEHRQYLARAANGGQQIQATHDDYVHMAHKSNARAAKQRTLKTSTLAEEASLKEIKVERAKAKAEALARAQLLMDLDGDDEEDSDASPDEDDVAPDFTRHNKEPPRKLRPLMPLKKLVDKVKADREARHKEAAEKEAMEADIVREAAKTRPDLQKHEQKAKLIEDPVEQDNEVEQDDSELEGIIAKLRQEALDRRLRKIHAAQKDIKQSHLKDAQSRKQADVGEVDDEARIRRPGIVKSRKVSTKEE